MSPKIILQIDAEEDIRDAVAFLDHNNKDDQMTGNFLPKSLQYLRSGQFSRKERSKIITAYTRSIYQIERKEIVKGLAACKKDWREVEKKYLLLMHSIFGDRIPKGPFVGHTTIFNMYQKYIDRKTFTFPDFHPVPHYSNRVIAHEVLHHIFFDYIKNTYKLREDSVLRGKSAQYVWEVSEVFNNVIEEWEPYRTLFPFPTSLYHGKVAMFKKMKKQWSKKQDIKWLLDQWLVV